MRTTRVRVMITLRCNLDCGMAVIALMAVRTMRSGYSTPFSENFRSFVIFISSFILFLSSVNPQMEPLK